MSEIFEGFPRELADFWLELHLNNFVDMQEDIKPKYTALISAPLTSLYSALLPTINELFPDFETRRARCVSSPYADRRFSRLTPFKEYMYIKFRKDDGSVEDVPGFYFDMGSEGYSYGLRIYNSTTHGTEAIRENIIDNYNIAQDAVDEIVAKGYYVIGDVYKRDRYPDLPQNNVKGLLMKKRFHFAKDFPVNDLIYSPKLVDVLIKAAHDLSVFRGIIY